MPNLFRHPTGKVECLSGGILKQVQDDGSLNEKSGYLPAFLVFKNVISPRTSLEMA